MRFLFIFVLFFCASSNSKAIQDNSLYLGLGTLSHGIFDVSQDSTSAPGVFGTFYFPFVLQSSIGLGSHVHLAPSISYTILGTYLFPKTSPEGGSKTAYLMLTLPVVTTFDEEGGGGLDWEVGPTYLMYSIQGSGGSTVLNNGGGFASFGLPGNTQNAWTLGLLLGAAYNYEDFRVEFDTVSEGLLTSRRTFSLMLTFSYNLIPSRGRY